MRLVYFKALPYRKEDVTLALEAGVDGLIVPDGRVEETRKLARGIVIAESEIASIVLTAKADEERAEELIRARTQGRANAPGLVVLARGWEIIPVENLLAAAQAMPKEGPAFALEAANADEARLAGGILECGVEALALTPEALPELALAVAAFRHGQETLALTPARITRISPAGMGHRVCVDTTSLLRTGQGMLVGNSAAFTFLINAETEHNEYVAARPFRINAGGVHAYALLPDDRTCYLEELFAGREVLIVGHDGSTVPATVGRVKIERRPMLLIEARIDAPGSAHDPDGEHGASSADCAGAARAAGEPVYGTVFLQNAETIRLVTPDGRAVSVVELAPGDTVLCRMDTAGRHFGMRISEAIREM